MQYEPCPNCGSRHDFDPTITIKGQFTVINAVRCGRCAFTVPGSVDKWNAFSKRISALAAANARMEGELAEAVKISQAQNDKYFAERRAHIETSRRAEQAEADAAFWEKEARRENTLRHTAEAERDALREVVVAGEKHMEFLVQCPAIRDDYNHPRAKEAYSAKCRYYEARRAALAPKPVPIQAHVTRILEVQQGEGGEA